jgi:hypothetical protein
VARWRLLFPADAEIESVVMRDLGVAGGLLVGHHSSHNGTPPDATLKQLAGYRGDVVTTYPGVYNGIPTARDAG